MSRLLLLSALILAFATAAPAEERVDVLLVTLDTLRADALGFNGNTVVSTPVLDRLAAKGRVFDDAHAHNVVTLPSHANILTGLYPYQHGVRDNGGFQLDSTVPTLATVLQAAGYDTAAFVGAFPLDSQFGLDHGFGVYDDKYPKGGHETEFRLPERRGDEVVAAALAWWRAAPPPRFMWVHLYDPHAPYAAPPEIARQYPEEPYLAEVAATDSYLKPLLEPFMAGRERSALVVLTADHGEALGDHGEFTHGLFTYEATLRVPLVVWGPAVEPGRERRGARHVDIFQTVLAATDVTPPEGHDYTGRSLLAPPEPEASTYFESISANLNRGWAPLRGLIQGPFKYIDLPVPELYHLGRDPAETTNLMTDDERARALAMRDALPRESVWPPDRADISPEVLKQLQSLGYLSGTSKARESYGPEDDPKNLIAFDRLMHLTIHHYSLGEYEEALDLAHQVVAERPDMAMGRSLLAQALIASGKTAEALATMRQARRDGVTTETLLRQLGLTLAETGETGEALQVLRPLAAKDNPESLNALALALSEAGRQDQATTALERVLAIDPENATAYEQLALVALRLERWDEAASHARRALEWNGQLPRAWNNLGVALHQKGDIGGALDAWKKATDYDPRLYDALYNLGTTALRHDRPDLARPALERFVETAPAERYAADLRRARVLLNRLKR